MPSIICRKFKRAPSARTFNQPYSIIIDLAHQTTSLRETGALGIHAAMPASSPDRINLQATSTHTFTPHSKILDPEPGLSAAMCGWHKYPG